MAEAVVTGEISEQELVELERLAVEMAAEAGRFIVEERPDRLGVADTKTDVNDIVTVMDQASERLLRERIAAARPDDAVLGEEGGASQGSSGITWVVDPIDGTVNYLYDIPAYCVSVAAVTGDPSTPGRWRPVAGAVCNPVSGEVFHARAGGGAHLRYVARSVPMPSGEVRSVALRTSDVDQLVQTLVGTGFGYRPEVRARQGALIGALLPQIRDIRRAGSAALDLCSVAAGRLDAYFESGLNAWDLAAGWLIVEEAGGLVTGARGQDPGKELLVAAGPAIHPALAQRVEELRAG